MSKLSKSIEYFIDSRIDLIDLQITTKIQKWEAIDRLKTNWLRSMFVKHEIDQDTDFNTWANNILKKWADQIQPHGRDKKLSNKVKAETMSLSTGKNFLINKKTNSFETYFPLKLT